MHSTSKTWRRGLTLFFLLARTVHADCKNLEAAREAYRRHDVEDAAFTLRCLQKQFPADLDVRRALSDMYWWEGDTGQSIAEARGILEHRVVRRAALLRLSLDAETLSGSRQLGNEQNLEADLRYFRKNHLTLGVSRQARVFDGGLPLTDVAYQMGHVTSLGKSFYNSNQVIFSPGAGFLPLWSFSEEPHFIAADDSDLSLAFRLQNYPTGHVYSIAPQWNKNVWSSLILGAQTTFSWAPELLMSASTFAAVDLGGGWNVRLNLAGGKVLESPGLVGSFLSLGLRGRYELSSRFGASLGTQVYAGSVRSEIRGGIGLDYFFK